MKKILFYIDTPMLGGTENHMLLLARFLPRDKYEITLACSNYTALNSWCQKFMEARITVMRLKVAHKHDPRHFLYLKKIIPRFDLVHTHLWNPGSCRYAFLASKRTPLVVTEHDPFLLKGLKGWIKKRLIQRAQKIIVASEASKNKVLEQDPSLAQRIVIIPNGIDVETWQQEGAIEDRAAFRAEVLGATEKEKIILCVAELHKRKGQRYLIEAFQEVVKKFPDSRLIFAGEGPERKNYEIAAQKTHTNIQFLGRRKDVAKLMSAADLFVLPSIREAFGLVVLEAAALSLPIVASRIGGIEEIIQDGITGLLAEPENAEDLAAKIIQAFEDADGTKKRTSAARAWPTNFSAETMARRTADVYAKVLNL